MLSVLRRRGLALWGEPTNGSVTVEFGYRRVTVHLTEDGWVQHPPHRPGPFITVQEVQAERTATLQTIPAVAVEHQYLLPARVLPCVRPRSCFDAMVTERVMSARRVQDMRR